MIDKQPLAPLPDRPAPGSWWFHPKSERVYKVTEMSYDSETGEPSVRYENTDGVRFNRPHRMWEETDAQTGKPRFVPCPPERLSEGHFVTEYGFNSSFLIPGDDPPSIAASKLLAAGQGVGKVLADGLGARQRFMRGKITVKVLATARPTTELPGTIVPASSLPPRV